MTNRESIFGQHEFSGTIVRGHDGVIQRVQCSLARIRYFYNGNLIKSQTDIERALRTLWSYLKQICTPVQGIIRFTRVDLVLNVPCSPKAVIAAHRNAKHPWVHRNKIEYSDSSIRFPGAERVIQFYCKHKEKSDKSGFPMPATTSSIRAEVQFKKKAVAKALGSYEDEFITFLDFHRCYNEYRKALCLFDPASISPSPTGKFALKALLAECEAQGFKTSFGMGALEWYGMNGIEKATLARTTAEVHRRELELRQFSWANLLPAEPPVPVVDIYSDGREEPCELHW